MSAAGSEHSVAASASGAGSAAGATNPEEKVLVQVVAQGDDGENIVDVSMKVNTPFAKMMTAWCRHHGLEVDDAAFLLGEQELSPQDSPSSCGWTPSMGPLRIQALPRDEGNDEEAEIGDRSQAADSSQKSANDPVPATSRPPEGPAADSNPSEAPVPSSQASSSGAARADQKKVKVEVVAEDANQEKNVVLFTMLPTTAFSKMMSAWCAHHGLQRNEACFLFKGREVLDSDTPSTCGWSEERADDGPLTIQAIPREDMEESIAQTQAADLAETQPASIPWQKESSLPSRGEPPAAAKPPATAPANTASKEAAEPVQQQPQQPAPQQPPAPRQQQELQLPAPKQPAPPQPAVSNAAPSQPSNQPSSEKVIINVLAELQGLPTLMTVKLKAQSPFQKVLNAWCSQHQKLATEVYLEHSGRELGGAETPAHIGWLPGSSTPFELRVKLRGAPQAAPPQSAPPEERRAEPAPTPAAETSKADTQGSQATDAPAVVNVEVVAEGSDGDHRLSFKMKMTTQFGKMMSRWSDNYKIPQDQAAFMHGETELRPEQTPTDVGWTSGQDFEVRAVPRDSLAIEGAPAKKPRKKRAAEPAGEPAVKRAATAYQCFQRVRRPALLEERPELSKQMGEVSRLLSAEFKALSPEEKQPYEDESARDRERVEAEKAAKKMSSAAALAEPATSSTSRAKPNTDAKSVLVRVVSDDDGTDRELRHELSPKSTVAVVMKEWCKEAGLPESEAVFLLGGRVVLGGDTPTSLGWSPSTGELLIRVMSKDTFIQDTQPPTAATDKASKGQGGASSSSALPAADSGEAAGSVGEPKLQVLVLADGEDGTCECRYSMKTSTSFEKLMKEWCRTYQIAFEEAAFLYEKRVLSPGDTPIDIGWATVSRGELVLHAVPKDTLSEEEVTRLNAAISSHTPALGDTEPVTPGVRERAPAKESPNSATPSAQHGKRSRAKKGQLAEERRDISPPPKRPISAFAAFCKAKRPALLEENPDFKKMAIGEQVKVFASHWKELSDEERAVYETEACDAKAKYEEAMRSYTDRHPEAQLAKRRRRSSAKPPTKRKSRDIFEDEAKAAEAAPYSSSSEAEGNPEGRRRSARLRAASREEKDRYRPGVDMIVHHPPPSTTRPRQRFLAIGNGSAEEHSQPLSIVEDAAPAQHMSYKEYLQYDRQQSRLIEQAREARARAKQVNGSVMDEDLQLALALSMSMHDDQLSTASTAAPSTSAASSSADRESC
mmetsp:Transcript_46860/g.111518  ORF Transcript_46860/g.111518 Transcript_46860/m.111518 type:complete len:1233 (-) Transcript_46860:145-3843(-)